jgi:hypothetical protein
MRGNSYQGHAVLVELGQILEGVVERHVRVRLTAHLTIAWDRMGRREKWKCI